MRGIGSTDLTKFARFRQTRPIVDAVDTCFQRCEPSRLTATITHADREGHGYTDPIPHDLGVGRDLAKPLPAEGPQRNRS
jgi:hypothetical protein